MRNPKLRVHEISVHPSARLSSKFPVPACPPCHTSPPPVPARQTPPRYSPAKTSISANEMALSPMSSPLGVSSSLTYAIDETAPHRKNDHDRSGQEMFQNLLNRRRYDVAHMGGGARRAEETNEGGWKAHSCTLELTLEKGQGLYHRQQQHGSPLLVKSSVNFASSFPVSFHHFPLVHDSSVFDARFLQRFLYHTGILQIL